MKILLDIDDTILFIKNKKEVLHPMCKYLIRHHDVTLFSASSDIKKWAKKLNVNYISKHDEGIPEADVLIDDDGYFKRMVKVKEYYSSIDSFLNSSNNNPH